MMPTGCLLLAALAGAPALAAPPQQVPAVEDALARRTTPIVAVVRAVGPTVVNISSDVEQEYPWPYNRIYGPQSTTSLGSGVIIDADGFIVTNLHVVKSPEASVRVSLRDGRTFDADLINVDVDHDLALLKITADEPLPAARLGSSRDVMIGETVVAIGNPLGNENTVTSGIVSSTFRDVRLPSPTNRNRLSPAFRDFIQTDAAINPGNSGGPLLNILGEVIGINVAIAGDAQNIGYAIPAERVRHSLVRNLINPFERVSAGFDIRGDAAGRNVVLARVDAGGVADEAGLRVGDRVLSVAGRPIDWEFDYSLAMLRQRPGDALPIVVERDGRTLRRELALLPNESLSDMVWRRVGLIVVDHPSYYGVWVRKVNPGGTAARFPLKPGDLIDSIDGHQVNSFDDFARIVSSIEPGTWVPLNVFREDRGFKQGYKGRLQVE